MGFLNELVGWKHGVACGIKYALNLGTVKDLKPGEIRDVRIFKHDITYVAKALNMGCSQGDSVDVADVHEFLEENNMTPETTDIEALKNKFPDIEQNKLYEILGTISVITFVESRGLMLDDVDDNLVSLSRYISKLEPGCQLPSPDTIAADVSCDIGLVNKYLSLLTEYNSMSKTLRKPFTIDVPENPQQIPVQQQNQKANRKSTKNQQPAAAQ